MKCESQAFVQISDLDLPCSVQTFYVLCTVSLFAFVPAVGKPEVTACLLGWGGQAGSKREVVLSSYVLFSTCMTQEMCVCVCTPAQG